MPWVVSTLDSARSPNKGTYVPMAWPFSRVVGARGMGTKDPLSRRQVPATVWSSEIPWRGRQSVRSVCEERCLMPCRGCAGWQGDRLAGGGPPSVHPPPLNDRQPQAHCVHDSLSPIAGPELVEDPAEVVADGLLADAQQFRDLR